MSQPYIPQKGDIVWLQFNPQAGHEQAGLRPAIVLSPSSYNLKVGLALVCPISSQVKGYPFEVAVSKNEIQGVILADQMKSLDWRKRNIQFISKADSNIVSSVIGKFNALLQA